MDHPEKITVCPVQWDTFAYDHLKGVGGLSSSIYRDMVERNEVNIFAVYEWGKRVATVLMRWETLDRTGDTEAVLVAAGGASQGDLTRDVLPTFEGYARKVGAKTFRLHTMRPGLVRKLAERAASGELVIGWGLV